MSQPPDGSKAAQTGLVDMGIISFYPNATAPVPVPMQGELGQFAGSFKEVVLNVRWADLQTEQGGTLTTSAIDAMIADVNSFNGQHGTDIGIKLRVYGGFAAPDWAKQIGGDPITIEGIGSLPTSQTIGRFWTTDYIDAWTSFQTALAGRYDDNKVIRGISNTSGMSESDEPFVDLATDAQIQQLQGAGYSDAAHLLTLRASIADYDQWSTTPLDFTINPFHRHDEGTNDPNDYEVMLAVLQQARNSDRLVQAGNHPSGSRCSTPTCRSTASSCRTARSTPD